MEQGRGNADRGSEYQENRLTLLGSIAMGTGVMSGAEVFALTGQVAELTGGLYPLAFVAAAVVVAFSAYSYVKVSNADPSAGGIAMILRKAYGQRTVTAGCTLLALALAPRTILTGRGILASGFLLRGSVRRRSA